MKLLIFYRLTALLLAAALLLQIPTSYAESSKQEKVAAIIPLSGNGAEHGLWIRISVGQVYLGRIYCGITV